MSAPGLNTASTSTSYVPPTTTSSTTTSTTSSISSTSTTSSTTTSSTPTSSPTPTSTSTSVFTSIPPASTVLVTSVVTPSSAPPSTQIIVTTLPPSTTTRRPTVEPVSTSATSTLPPSLQSDGSGGSGSGGLSEAGKVAVAVVVPVVVVALLVLAALFFWRKRKQRKSAEEERRKEVEEYGYNPNDDPTLPAVMPLGSDSPEMAEDTSGYRGWGNNTNPAYSNRKASTNLSSTGFGHAFSDDGNGRQVSPGSPDRLPTSDGAQSGDPLVEMSAAEGIGAGGAVATGANINRNGVQRGPSNASSQYSAAGRTDNSEELIGGGAQEFGYENNYSQYQSYNPGAGYTDQPVIRDVSARRNTKIENPTVYPQQGNSGIAQNF